jgi:XTP/dITP diphosphohydrolase
MSALGRVVLASGNAGKLREFGQLLAPLGLELLPQSAFGVPAAEEPFGTFLENALAKARHASRLTGLPALADDSGICVEALGGRPGVWSARWARQQQASRQQEALERAAHAAGLAVQGVHAAQAHVGGKPADEVDLANNAQLVEDLWGTVADGGSRMDASGPDSYPGQYYCVLVLLRAHDDPQPIVADGSWYGEVIAAPRGVGGFGYDAHFLIPSLGRTVAELDADSKNRYSHRGQAMRALVERLREAGLAAS